ncbi:hypothetical protein LXA43DRAFT_877615 [Ganoderma leucocontextum]|nr:hypothetical protein LXA43DRAFT_877615 [Ganoderma leucocontextum]
MLNDDVLFHLFEGLRPTQGLCALSSTCRWLREASMPSLFRCCFVRMSITERFLPTFAWPYVRYVVLLYNGNTCLNHFRNRELLLVNTHILGAVFCPSFLRDALQAMPRLRSVSVSSRFDNHGLSWETLDVFLSLPHLREFIVDSFIFCPRDFSSADGCTTSLAPLASLRYRKKESRDPPRTYIPEQAAVTFVSKMLHPTLESLELPVESTPLDALSLCPWPRLIELRLSGEYPVGLSQPLISILSSMSNLRVLALHFSLRLKTNRQQVWPSRHTTAFPWPELVDFSVSFPDPDDQIYDNLPNSLRRLSLRCCPHHCLQRWQPYEHRYWSSPILSASELSHILRRCNKPLLDALRIDYVEGGTDPGVLRQLPTLFPALTTLEVNRFREPDGSDVSIVRLCLLFCFLRRRQLTALHR